VANGVVYFGSLNYKMYALDAKTGTLLWSYATDYWIVTSPAVADGMVYVGSNDGHVYAFGLPDVGPKKKTDASQRPNVNTLHPDLNLNAF
jgi:hypothetical protein